jgi:hypothetical protein
MGVENPKISSVSKKTFIKTKNWKELCISFGYGLSKREGEQKAAKMSLILHEQLNEDQFTSSDVYYPSFNMKSKKKADTTSEDSGDSDDSGDSGDSNESDSAEQETETELETETKSKSKSEYKSDDMEDDINSNITESEIEDSD